MCKNFTIDLFFTINNAPSADLKKKLKETQNVHLENAHYGSVQIKLIVAETEN